MTPEEQVVIDAARAWRATATGGPAASALCAAVDALPRPDPTVCEVLTQLRAATPFADPGIDDVCAALGIPPNTRLSRIHVLQDDETVVRS